MLYVTSHASASATILPPVASRFAFFFISLLLGDALGLGQQNQYLIAGLYPVEGAAFGAKAPFDISSMDGINIMYPLFANESLCNNPKDLFNATNASFVPTADDPIAFLVSEGNCSAEQQAANAGMMKRFYSNKIQYLIVQGEPADGEKLKYLQPDGNITTVEFSNFTVVLYISYSGGNLLRQRIDNAQAEYGWNPYFMQPGNQNWRLIQSIQQDPTNNSQAAEYDFLSRTVLLFLIITAPCCRAVFLWYSGGGRICWRRDENGRIRGIQFVSPPEWFTSGSTQPESSPAGTLCEEQFKKLPEILYQPQTVENVTENVTDTDKLGYPVSLEIGSGAPEVTRPAQANQTENESSTGSELDPENDSLQAPGDIRCTMCSICLEEFKPLERLTLLPRCQHSYHPACIFPWLTERHGTCPLCKMHVLDCTTFEQDSHVSSSEEPPEERRDTDLEAAPESAERHLTTNHG